MKTTHAHDTQSLHDVEGSRTIPSPASDSGPGGGAGQSVPRRLGLESIARRPATALVVALLALHPSGIIPAKAQAPGPSVVDTNLAVRTVVSGLEQPIAMAFLGTNDFLVTEKASGKVKRVVDGVVTATVLDLPVNSASERGLLGMALHPRFKHNHFVYLYWTESSTGADSRILSEVGNTNSVFPPGTTPPLGNRVDRFIWDAAAQTLTFDLNLITLRAFQADAGQAPRGNHNGGVIRFQKPDADVEDDDDDDDDDDHGHDGHHSGNHDKDQGKGHDGRDKDNDDDHDGHNGGDHDKDSGKGHDGRSDDDDRAKLFILFGDNGRRGITQNLMNGPSGLGLPDDQFGGPEPDNNHLTGVILRLNDDGTTPEDNPFFETGAALGGEDGANLQKVFAYGIRNSFGMALDPKTGRLWESENGDDSFDEINRIKAGHNGGWIQIMGPVSRITEFKEIETRPAPFFGLEQIRWSPTNIADTAAEALARLVVLPNSHYADPEFSWKYAVAPAAIGFMRDHSLGREYKGDLFVGAARPTLAAGYLFRFKLTEHRAHLALSDPRLADGVADNTAKFDVTESESLLFGAGFGVGTDIQSGPKGNLFVVSTSSGAVYEIYRLTKEGHRHH
jgi:glucose/arabinose dehydrogenase